MAAHRLLLAGLVLLVLGVAACAPRATPAPVTVQLRWTHQAQFAGFYAADQQGYYAAEGLAVSFTEGGPDVDLLQPLIEGRAQFGVAGADTLILGRADGQLIRALATIYRRSPIVFITRADAGIARPQDFAGHTIHVPLDVAPAFHATMARAGVQPDQYTERNLGADLQPFRSGEVSIWGGLVIGQALYTLRQEGYALALIFPEDYGVRFYADTLFTTDALIARDPELVQRFVRATLKGWTYAVQNPQAIAPMVLKYKPNADSTYNAAAMIASLPLINTGEDHIGWMRLERWAEMEQTLREEAVLAQPVDIAQVFTMQFLEALYNE